MILRRLLPTLLATALLVSLPALAATPNVKVVVADASYVMGDSDTLAGAEENALTRAKRKAVEETGVYIEAASQDVEKHAAGQTTRLNSLSVRTLAAAITETEILEKRRGLEGERVVFYVKIKATINLDTLEEAIKRQKAYEQLAEHHHQLHDENHQLKSELDALRKQLRESRMVAPPKGQLLRNRRAAMDLVHAAIQSREFPEKIDLTTKAIAADDQYVDAYVVRGQTYLSIASSNSKKSLRTELNDYVDRAIADFDRALALDESSPWALLGRGDAFTWQKKPEEAAKNYERVLEIDPLFDVAQQRLIVLRTAVARKQIAARQWRQALDTLDHLLRPGDTPGWTFQKREAYILRSQVYAQMGQLPQAVQELTTVVQVDPTNRQAWKRRAKLYERLQQGRSAKDDYDRACSLGSDEACAAAARFSTTSLQ
ncbi:MAG: tetratricopeptide repeat protein [Nitrospiraceae bacterium]